MSKSANDDAVGASRGEREIDELNEEVQALDKKVDQELQLVGKVAKKAIKTMNKFSGSMKRMKCDTLELGEVNEGFQQYQTLMADLASMAEPLDRLSLAIQQRQETSEAVAKDFESDEPESCASIDNPKQKDLESSKSRIYRMLADSAAPNANYDELRNKADVFHDALALFTQEAILDYTAAMLNSDTAQASDQLKVISVLPLFEASTTDKLVKLMGFHEKNNKSASKEAFIHGINVLIGYALLNEKNKREGPQIPSSIAGVKRGRGNGKNKARSAEVDALVEVLKASGHEIAHSGMKSKLAAGELWKECIDPYKKDVWRVLPIFEFFQRIGMISSPAKIPRTFIKALFRCIKDTPNLHTFLVELCEDEDSRLRAVGESGSLQPPPDRTTASSTSAASSKQNALSLTRGRRNRYKIARLLSHKAPPRLDASKKQRRLERLWRLQRSRLVRPARGKGGK